MARAYRNGETPANARPALSQQLVTRVEVHDDVGNEVKRLVQPGCVSGSMSD